VHNMCLVRPALLYLNVHVLKVFYEQIYYYYYIAITPCPEMAPASRLRFSPFLLAEKLIMPIESLQITVSFFTALHAMQTRSSDENSVCPSVCLSVCLSVTRMDCDKTVERSVEIYIPHERTFILVS